MKVKNNPNVIPLCDILLVLLIIFMAITPMAQVGIDIKLPERYGNIINGGAGKVVVSIEGEKMFRVNGELFSNLADMEKRLKDIYISRPNKTIFVQADSKLKYRHLVQTVDVIRHAGLNEICLIPSPKKNRRMLPVPVIQHISNRKGKKI